MSLARITVIVAGGDSPRDGQMTRYEIRGANRETGQEVAITIEARDFHHAEEQANSLGVLIASVCEVHDAAPAQAPATPAAPVPPPSRSGGTTCSTCGRGRLYRRKVYRMSTPVAVIGYILLIPSFLGILLNLFILVAPTLGLTAAGAAVEVTPAQVKQMRDAEVPEPIINKVVNGELVTTEDRDSMTQEQQTIVSSIQVGVAGAQACACCGAGIIGGSAIVGMIVCFVSGLLGWLLVMKKKVLQCHACSAVVAAG